MKIAVTNFSGNVGKTTVSRYCLLPRIKGAVIAFLWAHRIAAPKSSPEGLDLSP